MCPASVGTSRASRALETGEAKLWALLVGVNQYADKRLPALSYSALDCQGLGEALTAATRTFPQKTLMVHHDFAATVELDGSGQARSLPDQVAVSRRLGLGTIAKLRNLPAKLPKQAAVQSSLQQIVQAAKPQDTVLFYFSGHGVLESASHQAVLCLTDTNRDDLLNTGLGLQALLQLLSQCQAHQQIVWLDACHSGGMTLRQAGQSAIGQSTIEASNPTLLPNPTPQLVEVLQQQAARSQGFYALLSCDQNQLSWEFPELGHGVFTYYLMRGLLGEAADAQGKIEADALYKYVYYQTLRYIDKTNQQLRLINRQKRGRGEIQLQPEYPLQTPKRIVEGIGELVIGAKPELATLRHPRQALVVEGLTSNPTTLTISKILRSEGSFELSYFPQSGTAWAMVRSVIQACLQSNSEENADDFTHSATVLLYLRGQIKATETQDACLVLRNQVEISRSWLRQELRRSPIARQIVILDCPGATQLEDWIEDLQTTTGRGQCLIAVASPEGDPDWFAQALLETLSAAEPQVGLPIAGWIAQLQARAAEAGIMPYIWLSGTQGVIEVLPGRMETRGSSSDAFDLGICPYLGLRAFSEEDAPFFFGREALVQQLIAVLMQQSFLAVVGASGSGKSSVVQAGLVAQLRQGKQIPGSETWWMQSLRPGEHPLNALIHCLALGNSITQLQIEPLPTDQKTEQIEGILYQGIESFVYWLRSRPEPMVVLVIDQFEELFTLAAAEERQRFLELVLGAIEHAGDRFKLVITLRSDFVAPCLEFPALAQALQQSSILVPPVLSEAAYRQVILDPAEKVGLKVEPELVEVLLQDLSHTASDLPLLEFVLEQLWENRRPGELSLQIYQQKIGGLKGALERKAQTLYDSLDAKAQACARWIFLALTQLGEGTEDTRRRITRSNLIVKKYPADLVDRTLQALVAAKLIVMDVETEATPKQPQTGAARAVEKGKVEKKQVEKGKVKANQLTAKIDPALPEVTVEVAHEILIRHWSTLRWWLEENRSRLRTQRQIEQASLQWWQSGQQADFLLRGVRLDAAEELYVNYTDELSQAVQQFIEAGLAEREREQQQTKRRLRRAQAAVVLIGSLGIAAAGFGGFAYLQRQQALLNKITTLNALSESQLLANQQLEALTTSLEAGQQLQQISRFGITRQQLAKVNSQTIATLQQAVGQTQESNRLEGHSERVNTVAVSPNGQQIASGSDDGTVRLWQPNGKLIATLPLNGRVIAVAFTPDSQRLATANAEGMVLIWDVATGKQQMQLDAKNWATSLAFSANGQLLAVGSRDKTVKLWNVANGQLLKTLSGHQGFVNSVSFGSDGLLASASEDSTIRLWNANGRLLRTLTGHQGRVSSVAFSPDGKTLASGGEDQTVRLWQVNSGQVNKGQRSNGSAQILAGHEKPVTQVQFSRDGQRLVSASADGTLKLWQINGTLIATIKDGDAAFLNATFSPDGRMVVSGGADKTVRLWDLQSLETPSASAYAVSVSSDGQIATAGWDGKIQIWRKDGDSKILLKTWSYAAPISSLSFSPDGQQLAAGSDDHTVNIWTSNGTLLHTLNGHTAKVTSVSISPDGKWLASASEDKTIRLWNTKMGTLVRVLAGHENGVSSVVWRSDSSLLASGSYDHTIKLWQPNGTLLKTIAGHTSAISALAFSPDGQVLASASWDNTVRVWQVSDAKLLHILNGHQDGVTSLAFDPTGVTLASGSADHTVKLWNLADGILSKTLLGFSDAIQSLSFSKDGIVTASESQGLQILPLNLSELLQRGCNRIQNYLSSNEAIQSKAQSICQR